MMDANKGYKVFRFKDILQFTYELYYNGSVYDPPTYTCTHYVLVVARHCLKQISSADKHVICV